MVKRALKLVEQELKLDLGCGKGANTPDGFTKVDIVKGKDVEVVDLTKRWPWATNSVDEAQSNYLLHYLTTDQRIHFMNELWRVLKPGARCVIFTPHWSANKAYGDLNAQWPPVVEAWYPFLNKAWRESQNCDVTGYKCDFDSSGGYGLNPQIQSRNQEYQQHAVSFFKEAAQELVVTVTALK